MSRDEADVTREGNHDRAIAVFDELMAANQNVISSR